MSLDNKMQVEYASGTKYHQQSSKCLANVARQRVDREMPVLHFLRDLREGGGAPLLIQPCVVILKQVITDPPLNTDILDMKIIITDIHSLTYRNNPHNSQKNSIFN